MPQSDRPGTNRRRSLLAVPTPEGNRLRLAGAVVILLVAATALMGLGDPGGLTVHAMYVPIVVSGYAFGVPGGLTTAVLAGLIAGPLLSGETQPVAVWASQGGFFLAAGVIAGLAQLVLVHHVRLERASAARFEELARLKDFLIAAVSHELRTPITSVLGLSQEIRDHFRELALDEIEELIGLIAEESLDMAHIVEDLLMAARIDIGELVLDVEPVDLADEVDSVLRTLRLRITLPLETDLQPVPAMADPARLRQILRNLVTNAVRYGRDFVTVRTSENGDRARIEVVDGGPGVPEGDRELIFEPFQRSTREGEAPGSIGLGLAVSRQLASLMGGDLTYTYRGQRSIFALDLPRPAQPPQLDAPDDTGIPAPVGAETGKVSQAPPGPAA